MKKISVPKISLKDIRDWIESMDRKTLIQIGIVVGAFLIFIFCFLLPILVHNQKLSNQAKGLKATIAQASVKILRIPEMTRQKKMFGAKIKQVREQFFEIEEADRLIEIVSNIAADSGVKISASRPSNKSLEFPPPFSLMYVAINYELAVEGPYHSLGTFVNRLERYSKNLSIHSLEITGGEKVPAVQQSTLILTAFLKRPKA